MQQARREELHSIYWDMYKDAHGIRPRHTDTSGWSEEDFDKELAYLQGVIDTEYAEQQVREAAAAVAFEQRINDTVALGAWTRDNAIRWIHEAEETQGDDEYLCYKLGLKYGYFRKQQQAA